VRAFACACLCVSCVVKSVGVYVWGRICEVF